MNILQVNNYGYTRGGSDACYLATQALLRDKGHTVSAFNVQDGNAGTQPVAGQQYWPAPVNLVAPAPGDIARFLYSFEAKKNIGALCEAFRPDVAHLHIYYGQLTTSILHALKKQSVPVVQTLHEFKLVCPVSTMVSHGNICEACAGSHYWHAVSRRCNQGSLARSALSAAESYLSRLLGSWRHVDHFIAVSDFLRDKMIGFGLPPEKISTVHNFIDVGKFTPSEAPGDYFLYLGRLEKIKGVMTLLEAMRHVPGKLLVVGDGPARGEMEAFICAHAMANVEMLGFRKGVELHALIRGSRCVVAPSEWYETFGLIAIEAYAHGRPVIASNIGGLAEIITDRVNGWLFPPGNVDCLMEAMDWMWNNPAPAVEMGRHGRDMVSRRFSVEKHYNDLVSVYRKVIPRQDTPVP